MKGVLLDSNDTFLPNYLKAVNFTDDIFGLLNNSCTEIEEFYTKIPQEKQHYAYKEGKWTISEVLQHIIDSERIISMRALCFARGETMPLPGFDQDVYMQNAQSQLSFSQKLEELLSLRKSNVFMFNSFSEVQLLRTGVSSGFLRNVLAHAYLIVGHELHHRKALEDKYRINNFNV